MAPGRGRGVELVNVRDLDVPINQRLVEPEERVDDHVPPRLATQRAR
jgi:hypothetical protein